MLDCKFLFENRLTAAVNLAYCLYFIKASVAQLVEHYLAKVDVESSNLFARSIFNSRSECIGSFFVSAVIREP